ncbi:MAG: hypothetical protein KDI68_05970 [Gammaproteobacteria bacterium]|nr:hypothetical protein [Gammaproteobacteria bacterium]
MKLNKFLGMSILITALSPLESMAAQVFVGNAGFEAVVLSDGAWATGNVPDWTILGVAGTFNPDSGSMPGGSTPEGNNMVFVHGGSLTQTLGTTLTANTTYTLTMDVIKRSDTIYQSAPYLIELLAGNDVIAQDNNSLAIPSGTWQTSTLIYDALPGDLLLGSALGIRISGDAQTSFDRVVLDASPVIPTPVPAALPLFASALGWMGFAGWKRKKAA